ncbi:MAG: NAD-dependent epimerase/dehydratase [Frankiales bacterium]|nr:NAD-dependent epimerase/dehydratase [Frankiales bacterium]
MPAALITGITGQDGGYLAERLLAEDYAVHGLVHDGDLGVPDLLRRCPSVVLHQGDLTHEASLAAVVSASAPDEVYNLAGISSVAFSWEQPVLTADVTALGAARLLEQVWQCQERTGRPVRFVQASSAEIFGDADVAPQDESTPVRPSSPYGASKAFAHQLVGVYRGRGLHAVSAILYNHESPRRPPTFVTRKITRAAARIARGLEHELVLGNLDARRDWGWAPDYVDAMVRAARHSEPADYVVATGEAHSVRDFVAAAFARAGVAEWGTRVRVDQALVRPSDAALQVGDATRARTRLGWKPTVDFDELVGRMVEADLQQVPAS